MSASGPTMLDALFDPDRRDPSIWHALPRGLHSLGLLSPPPQRDTVGPYEATDTTQSTDDRVGRRNRPPALAHGTIQAVLPDAITLWLEGAAGLSREAFRRVDWRWWPTHVAGIWEAGEVRIVLRASMISGDDARIDVQITNTSSSPLEADLVIRGDDNYLTICRGGAHKVEGQWAIPSEGAVLVEKRPLWAQEMEYFPYSGVLPPDDPKFEYTPMHYQFVIALGDGGWSRETADGASGFRTWQLRRKIKLSPNKPWNLGIGFAAYWSGRREVSAAMGPTLLARAEAARRSDFDDVVKASRVGWEQLLATAPALKRDWPAAWRDLYYKAWVTVWACLLPPGDLGSFDWTRHVVTCLRIGDTPWSNPASWEGALGALILSLADPKLGCECLEAIYDTTHEDGYISETLGTRRGTALACVEPWIALMCYRRSGDKEFLRRIWDRLRRNLAYRLHFPVFKHGTVFNLRNYAYGNISARAALKIAREIGAPASHVAQVQQMADESERIVHAFWNEERGYHHASIDPNERAGGRATALSEGTEAALLVALHGVARPNERDRMIEFCRREYLTESGSLRRYPKSAPQATGGHRSHLKNLVGFTVKESELLAIFKGLKDADRALFETVARGTVANIAADGDFWEGMTLDGHGKHNGPGSIFGAFAVIWALLLMEDQVDSLYE